MELVDRVKLYNDGYGTKYPGSYIHSSGKWHSALWMLGNDYRSVSGFYGSYPPTYLRRVMSMFPDSSNILHAFSGSLPSGNYTRVDIDSANNPDVVCKVECMPFPSNTFDLVLADPPYSRDDAAKYGTGYPNKRLCLREIHRVLLPDGHLVWLDTQLPMYRKDIFLPRILIGIIRSTNQRVRLCTIFEEVN